MARGAGNSVSKLRTAAAYTPGRWLSRGPAMFRTRMRFAVSQSKLAVAQVALAAGAGRDRDYCGVRHHGVGYRWLQPAVRSGETWGFDSIEESALVAGSEGVAAAGYEILWPSGRRSRVLHVPCRSPSHVLGL